MKKLKEWWNSDAPDTCDETKEALCEIKQTPGNALLDTLIIVVVALVICCIILIPIFILTYYFPIIGAILSYLYLCWFVIFIGIPHLACGFKRLCRSIFK